MAFNLFKIFSPYVSSDELEDFLIWAFGANFEEMMTPYHIIQSWNEHHWQEYQIPTYHTLSDDIEDILKIWKLIKKERALDKKSRAATKITRMSNFRRN